MNKNAIILHGTNFDPDRLEVEHQGNWFPWLKEQLESDGYKVWLPELPEAWAPNINNYWEFLKDFDFNSETIIIGHSSGAAAILGILQRLPAGIKINKAILVAGFYHDEGWNCEKLFDAKIDFEKIKNSAEKIEVIWSPQDPYISKEQTEYLAENLGVKPIIIPDSGHFNLEYREKFRKFPDLLDLIIT
ncbi:MAG: alpha/beta hydrolase [bacterium]